MQSRALAKLIVVQTNRTSTCANPLQLSLICGRQRHRDSRVTAAKPAEDYYRRTVHSWTLNKLSGSSRVTSVS